MSWNGELESEFQEESEDMLIDEAEHNMQESENEMEVGGFALPSDDQPNVSIKYNVDVYNVEEVDGNLENEERIDDEEINRSQETDRHQQRLPSASEPIPEEPMEAEAVDISVDTSKSEKEFVAETGTTFLRNEETFVMSICEKIGAGTKLRSTTGREILKVLQLPSTFNELYKKLHIFFQKKLDNSKSNRNVINDMYEEVKEELRHQGFCCGEYHPYFLTVISCEGDDSCGIKPEDTFYSTTFENEEYCFCPAHYNLDKNRRSVKTKDGKECLKKNFVKKVNNEVESETIKECEDCKKFWHEACRYSNETTNQCGCSDVETGFKYLSLTHLSNYMENEIVHIKGVFGLHVRVIRIKRETVRIGEQALQKIYKGAKTPYVSYTKKKVMIFQKQNEVYINFMTFTVKEFDHGWTVLNYLDSVQYLETDPPNLRSMVYKQIINAYFNYAKSIGFHHGHIWANAPEKDGDFFFNVHPESQRWLEQSWLQKWYWDLLVTGALNEDLWTFRTEIDFSSAGTMEDLHQSLIFSSYWMSILEEILSEESNKKIDVHKIKKLLSDRHKQNKGSLFYIDLIRKPWEQKLEIYDQDEEMECSIAESREKWLNCQFENNLQFGTKRRAIHASTRLIQLINMDRDEREIQYIYG